MFNLKRMLELLPEPVRKLIFKSRLKEAAQPRLETALPAPADDKPWDEQFARIVQTELQAVNSRRESLGDIRFGGTHVVGGRIIDVVGLALSGGGIRSSAVCLGVLQALNHHDLIRRIDYLSTVSGGGYIGSALSATMTVANRFVFGERPNPDAVRQASEISDTPAVGHIRNYSNYLIPAGARDLLTGIAIVVRGLVANLSLTLPVVLLLAALTVFSNPARSCLYTANLFGVGVKDGRALWFLGFLGNTWIVKTFGFSILGVLFAVLILLAGRIHRVLSDVDRRDVFRYLAGIAFTTGVISNAGRYFPVEHFALTLTAALIGLLLFLFWALRRSCLPGRQLQEFRSHLPTMGATYLSLLALIAFFEFQPFMIAQMFGVADGAGTDTAAGLVSGVVIGWIRSVAAIAAPIAAAVTVFRQQFADLLKGAGASDLSSRLLAYVARAAVWVAGLALPLLIWIGYLYLCFWGVANDKVLGSAERQCKMPEWSEPGTPQASSAAAASMSGKIQFNSESKTFTAEIAGKDAPAAAAQKVTLTSHIPGWLLSGARVFGDSAYANWPIKSEKDYFFANNVNLPMVWLYVTTALILFLLSWFLRPNANSLHRLYRDRLSKAFLFDPRRRPDAHRVERDVPSIDQGRDFPELMRRLSGLCRRPRPGSYRLTAPYHLINAALNIQGSDYANRRGRNADFFLFSPLWTGSEATGYCDTRRLEKKEAGLDLGTAMAISGAAASSNMGANSIRPLTPTLALLNVRLGYWLKNPQYVDDKAAPRHRSSLYLWSEISGRLYENADAVYLTDGGHIENLGVYELLRRRCKVIIAVDAEADEPMNFSSLMTLQRYARIDLGIRIDLPWTPIRKRTLDLMRQNAGKTELLPPPPAPPPPPPPTDHPHVAIGTIDYGGGQVGYLVYIKSSLTGDENDYIRDYARRNDSFPHETTGDQFFSEEQFEVYRALGFHMTHGFLCGEQDVMTGSATNPSPAKFTVRGDRTIDAVREALGLPPGAPS